VYYKESNDKSIVVYLLKKHFYNHGKTMEPIIGVVVIKNPDTAFSKESELFAVLLTEFNYNKDIVNALGLEVKNQWINYPVCLSKDHKPDISDREHLTPEQKELVNKYGDKAYPFTLHDFLQGEEIEVSIKYESPSCIPIKKIMAYLVQEAELHMGRMTTQETVIDQKLVDSFE
ncbi:hypothetical protein Ciccas_008346, partial [Cichlidogyrus casuarinus]